MAVKSIFLLDTLRAGSNHLDTQDGGTAPTTANMSTGWVQGTTAGNNFSAMDSQTKPVSTSFGTTAIPAAATVPNNTTGDAWVLGPFSGSFAATNWTLAFNMIGVGRADTTTAAVTCRILQGATVTGASSTEVTSALQTGSTAAVMNNTAAATTTVTWAAPAITCANEFLFVKCAFKIVTAGTNGSTDSVFRKGSASVITTADFTQFPHGRVINANQAVMRAANW